jgi:hypothetical protein
MVSSKKGKELHLQKATDLDHRMVCLLLDYLQVPQFLYNILPCSHLKQIKVHTLIVCKITEIVQYINEGSPD